MSISGSYLTLLYNNVSNDGGASLLNALYGFAGPSGGTSGLNPIQALLSAETNETKQVAATTAQPTVKNAIAAFTKAVTSATSVKQLLADPAVMKVLLTANGLGDQVAYTALATKALTSDLTDKTSLAYVLPNPLWKSTATTYDFAAGGLTNIQKPATIATITQAYAKTLWEQDQDKSTPGMANALAFRAQASSIKTVTQILGNSTYYHVVTMALGVPLQIAFQSPEAQALAISSRLDVTQFQDPKFVESFTDRYLIANAAAVATAATASAASNLTSLSIQA